jgi:hypothetical protein
MMLSQLCTPEICETFSPATVLHGFLFCWFILWCCQHLDHTASNSTTDKSWTGKNHEGSSQGLFNILSRNLPDRIAENYENLYGQLMFQLRLQPSTFQTQILSITAVVTMFTARIDLSQFIREAYNIASTN